MGFTFWLSMAFCDPILKVYKPVADRTTKSNVPIMFPQQPSFCHEHMRKKRLLIWIIRWQDAGQKQKSQEKSGDSARSENIKEVAEMMKGVGQRT